MNIKDLNNALEIVVIEDILGENNTNSNLL